MKSKITIVGIYLVITLFVLPEMAQARGYDYKYEGINLPVCRPDKCLPDGLYVGGGLGSNAYRIRQDVDVIDTDGTLDVANPALNANNIQERILVGYGRYFDWFYFAGEAWIAYSGASTNFSINDYQSSVSTRTSYAASLLPGMKLTQASRVYGRLGFVRTLLQSSESGTIAGSTSTSHWCNGFALGLGIETVVYKNISIRGDYTYASYGSFNSSLGTSFTPSNNQFMLDVLYYFV